jgi:hypothetical protein
MRIKVHFLKQEARYLSSDIPGIACGDPVGGVTID